MKREMRITRFQMKELLTTWSMGPGMVADGSVLIPQPGSSPNYLLLGFYGSFITSV